MVYAVTNCLPMPLDSSVELQAVIWQNSYMSVVLLATHPQLPKMQYHIKRAYLLWSILHTHKPNHTHATDNQASDMICNKHPHQTINCFVGCKCLPCACESFLILCRMRMWKLLQSCVWSLDHQMIECTRVKTKMKVKCDHFPTPNQPPPQKDG